MKAPVRIYANAPIFIELNPDEFGRVFSALNSIDQVNVFRSMIEHMKSHRQQWDYVSIELEQEPNRDVADFFKDFFASAEVTK